MRNAVIIFFMIVILIMSGAAIHTVETKTIRKNELDSSLGAAMEQSMKILTINPTYHIERSSGSDEFAADFIQGFLMKVTSNSNYTIEILKIDVEKGLLDVQIVEKYKHIIGYGQVSCRKTVILEALKEAEDVFYDVLFWGYNDESKVELPAEYIIKKVSIQGGDKLNSTILPKHGLERTGYVFCGWKMEKPINGMNILYGDNNIELINVNQELEFRAVYEPEEV
jgi:hypothetical protein